MAASIELSAGLPLCELSSPELSLLRCYAEQIGLGKATPRQRAKARMFAPSRTYRNQHELPLVAHSGPTPAHDKPSAVRGSGLVLWHIVNLPKLTSSSRQAVSALTGATALSGIMLGLPQMHVSAETAALIAAALRIERSRDTGVSEAGWPSAGPILTISQPYLSHVEVSP